MAHSRIEHLGPLRRCSPLCCVYVPLLVVFCFLKVIDNSLIRHSRLGHIDEFAAEGAFALQPHRNHGAVKVSNFFALHKIVSSSRFGGGGVHLAARGTLSSVQAWHPRVRSRMAFEMVEISPPPLHCSMLNA